MLKLLEKAERVIPSIAYGLTQIAD